VTPAIKATNHLGLARWVVAEFVAENPEHCHLRDDLVAGASLGICVAAERHDGRIGTWGVFAHRYAYGYMMIALRSLAYPTRPAYIDGEVCVPTRVDVDVDDCAEVEPNRPEYDAARELESLLAELTPRQREVMERRHGLRGRRAETVARIACAIGMSPAAVVRTERIAMRRLRAMATRGTDAT
jgi:DNA-directed RNA polymerase specialized sigma24 family protein